MRRRCLGGAPQWPAAADRHPNKRHAARNSQLSTGPPGWAPAPGLFSAARASAGRPGGRPGAPARQGDRFTTVDLDWSTLPFCRAPAHQNPAVSLGPLQRGCDESARHRLVGAGCVSSHPLLDPGGNSAVWRRKLGSQAACSCSVAPLSNSKSRWPVPSSGRSLLLAIRSSPRVAHGCAAGSETGRPSFTSSTGECGRSIRLQWRK